MKKRALIIVSLLLFMGGAASWYFLRQSDETKPSSTAQTETESDGTTTTKPEPTTPTFDKQQYSLTEPSSLWVIVNKQNSIPISYRPELVVPNVRLRLAASQQQMQISTEARAAVEDMFQAAQRDGVSLVFGSGYRSGALQQQFYSSYKAKDGQAAADRYSARPGHSEHQTGLSFDITSPSGSCHLQICWEQTAQGRWVAANAHTYGFILRYPKGKEPVTGYQYEPWHFRYVGKGLAAEINKSGQTLEKYFGLPAAPSYD